MVAFGWIALVAPDTPETACVFLFAALLHTVVSSRRCTSAFLAGAIPVFILLVAVQIEAYFSGVPSRRLILIGLAILIASGFCTVLWHDYSKSLSQAMAGSTAKSAFLANMSHELRTPLNGVVAMASALRRTDLSLAQSDMVAIIGDSAGSLQTLVSDLLDLAKIEAGHIDLQSEPLAPAALARHVAVLFREPAREKGLTFDIEADAQSEVAVLGDSVRLTQILTNFCSNAVKFTSEGGVKLSVKSVQNGQTLSIRFDVADSGIGMSQEASARIFERFSQADGSITRRFGGTGLGLAISKQLADLMGGRILVKSSEGRGATFSLMVEAPLADAVSTPQKSAQDARRAQAAELASPKLATAALEANLIKAAGRIHDATVDVQEDDRPHLLLVEDHPTNRQVIQILLGDLVRLDMVCDGAQGVEAAQRSTYDLILMDMQMPVMDGLSATRAIRVFEQASGRRRTPIIVLSANALAEHVEAAIQAGADGHLAKPVTANALLEAISSALADSAERSEIYTMADEAVA
jgi:signal transduction histidine kinase/CheY-like chemotaxis protein